MRCYRSAEGWHTDIALAIALIYPRSRAYSTGTGPKRPWFASALLAIALASILAHPLMAKTIRYQTAHNPGSLKIKGTSTLHHWSIRSKGLGGTAVFKADASAKSPQLIPEKLHLTIAVLSLKGSDGSGMDATIYRKLISGRDPKITYVLKKAVLLRAAGRHQPWSTWNTTGVLTAAGHPQTVHLKLKILTAGNGAVSIETRTVLKMTDFGISPPTAMLGIIRSGNKMKIKVLWNLTPQKP